MVVPVVVTFGAGRPCWPLSPLPDTVPSVVAVPAAAVLPVPVVPALRLLVAPVAGVAPG